MAPYDVLNTAYKFAKRGGIIPSELSSGQLSMLPHNYGAIPTPKSATAREIHTAVVRGAAKSLGSKRGGSVQPKPPFNVSKPVSGSAKRKAKLAARNQELSQKRAAAGVGIPGKPYKIAPKARRIGPNTASEAKVDDLFGKAW